MADSTSVNLFKLAAGALSLRPGRTTILSETGNFPTDLYVLQGLSALIPGVRLNAVDAADLPAAIDEDVAVVVLTEVHYKSARRWDMAALTAAAHAKGALILWDLSHSTGAVATGPQRRRRGPGGRLRLQVPERRPRSPGLPVRRRTPPGGDQEPPHRLDGPRRTVRIRRRLPPRG